MKKSAHQIWSEAKEQNLNGEEFKAYLKKEGVIVGKLFQQIMSGYISHQSETDAFNSILIMKNDGTAFSRIYWFNDDNTTVYLDWLSVDEPQRKKGIGKKLQEIREEIGRMFGAKTACLWVNKNSWMHAWYQRRGYVDWKDYEQEENCIWMQKII